MEVLIKAIRRLHGFVPPELHDPVLSLHDFNELLKGHIAKIKENLGNQGFVQDTSGYWKEADMERHTFRNDAESPPIVSSISFPGNHLLWYISLEQGGNERYKLRIITQPPGVDRFSVHDLDLDHLQRSLGKHYHLDADDYGYTQIHHHSSGEKLAEIDSSMSRGYVEFIFSEAAYKGNHVEKLVNAMFFDSGSEKPAPRLLGTG